MPQYLWCLGCPRVTVPVLCSLHSSLRQSVECEQVGKKALKVPMSESSTMERLSERASGGAPFSMAPGKASLTVFS